MKKRLLILVGFLLYFTTTNAQIEQSEHFLFEGNAAVDFSTTDENIDLKMQMQIGSGLPYFVKNTNAAINAKITTGFPYNVLYISPTFIEDKFEVSKGYFTDRVNIKWQIGANREKIDNIELYRRVLGAGTDWEFIANVRADDTEYRDELIEGGILFEYQIRAIGIAITEGDIGKRGVNYMEGIGFRNPTATVSGGVTYEGGSPVQDVTVFAEPIGAENRTATSLYIPSSPRGGAAKISDITNIKADSITFQSWLVNDTNIFSFKLSDNSADDYEIYAGKWTDGTIDFVIEKNNQILSGVKLSGAYPTGEIDGAGNDIIKPISSLKEIDFVHYSFVFRDTKRPEFYVNGRLINKEYESYARSLEGGSNFRMFNVGSRTNDNSSLNPLSLTSKAKETNVTEVTLGNGFSNVHMDEARVWNRALSSEEIRRDYRRYLDGGETGLAVYLRMDESAGDFLYDLSKDGFTQNKNDALLSQISNSTVKFSDTIPAQKQLGVFGVTDQNGSYIISGIGFKGTGESFVVTPSLGVHKFEPGSQTVFLGKEAPVVNQLNFTDVSSFKFNGRVVYNAQDVFNPIETSTPTNLSDYGYNKYKLGTTIINKGEYYYEGGIVDPTSGFYKGGTLKRYPIIPVEGANILVDGNTVFDADNQPVLSDENGNFTVSVPIGNHKVEVVKNGHTFELKGRFPETGTFTFFEDAIETQYFTDNTRVSLVGRVVGGQREFEKPIGFGFNGEYTAVSNRGEEDEVTETVSSNNNIGIANITFKGDIQNREQDKIVKTDSITGEYKVDLLPIQYAILDNGIRINSNTDLKILSSTEILDLREIPDELLRGVFVTEDDREIESDPYHFEKSFRYNSSVSVFLLEQQYERELVVKGTTFDVSELDVPIYKQKKAYNIVFEVTQKYVNNDNKDKKIETKEFFRNGIFKITNNLAGVPNNPEAIRFENNKYIYTFRAGYPNTTLSEDFKSAISVGYQIDGSNTIRINNTNDFKEYGVIQGGKPFAGTTFVTAAPETPDIILRDPPGSNSFASIEQGTTITYEESRVTNDTEQIGGGYFISLGPEVDVEVAPIPGLSINLNEVAETSGTFSKKVEELDEGVTRNTYTFNQTISTSDSPEFVGSDGDLFIGNAKNIYMGLFDNMYITERPPTTTITNPTTNIQTVVNIPNITLSVKDESGNPKTLYLSTYKDVFIAEQPTKTFFTYSQKYLVEELIPELDGLAKNGNISGDGSKSKAFFKAQANLWRKVVSDNERAKYLAKNNRSVVKDSILSTITSKFKDDTNSQVLRSLLDRNFFSNRSFDAGLGQFTNSVESVTVVSNIYETIIDISDEFNTERGGFLGGVGGTLSMTNSFNSITDDTDTDISEQSTTISYTLKDNDKNNLLSVDVVNMFDGNGPVFITKGGNTSCPYEDEDTSKFYNHSKFVVNSNYLLDYFNSAAFTAAYAAIIQKSIDNDEKPDYGPVYDIVGGEELSVATNNVYDVEISVKESSLSNIPEDENAVFILLLKNTSQTQTDLEYVLDFNSDTFKSLEINIESNGLNLFLPFNETVEFPVVVSKPTGTADFTVNDMEIFIHSPCATTDEKRDNLIKLSVNFKKSCSNVEISSPENNWVFNNNEAYSNDVSGNITTNKLPITLTDFNTSFTGFEKIELQYRNASAANWTKFASYYGSDALRKTAGDNDGFVIQSSDVDFTYNWDIVGDNIPDGAYEFRAVTFCSDNIVNPSEIITGTINLNAPLVFGTPKPTDGILDPGEDISVRFNEPVFRRTTTSINVTGLKNQQIIDHNVSVILDGSANNSIELPNQRLGKESFTLQFWLDSNTTGVGDLVSQENGINVKIDGKHLEFSIAGKTVSTKTSTQPITDSGYNFYSFVYQNGTNPLLQIMENGNILSQYVFGNNEDELDINTNAPIFIGGQNVLGNIHDIRLWSKPFTAAQAALTKDVTLTGREVNLLGYWKLDEGFGKVGLDRAKRKNAIVDLGWGIFPNGTAYQFNGTDYLTLDKVGFVQPTNFEDITLSFWIKPNATSSGTIFSNGRGEDDTIEDIKTNGFRNKWSVNLKSDGHLELVTENIEYQLTSNILEKDAWTHVAIVRKVGGTLSSYINGQEESSVSSINTGGFSGNKILVGARLFEGLPTTNKSENHFTGLLDEIRFWNTARSIDQIKRDRYFEIASNTEGLILKLDFNQDANNTNFGPAYDRLNTRGNGLSGLEMQSVRSILSGSSQTYSVNDAPPLKPELKFTNIPVNAVINGDEMIITPNLTDEEWSLFEGEIINFSVSRLVDAHFNTQASPVTWSALVNRQELEWFTEDQTKEITTEKILGETYSFTMDVVNIGGSNQPYNITGLPTWMQASVESGSIAPNASKQITFTVDKDLAMGNYTVDLFLETDSGFNDRLFFNMRVLSKAPDWSVNAVEYSYSMNFIGKIQIDGIFSRDEYTKVGAFVDDIPRGEAYLKYDAAFDSYFVFLTAYSNIEVDPVTGSLPIEKVTFKIWDAINGKIIAASMDNANSLDFIINGIEGSKSRPKIFATTSLAEQNLALNRGWTWISLFADDANLSDINQTLSVLNPEDGDGIKSQTLFANFEKGVWNGNLTGLSATEMYKIKLKKAGNLRLLGPEIAAANFNLNINGASTSLDGNTPQWNWLSFPIHRDIALLEALAFYDATDGDVIKDQFNFAIYDATSGWSGTLNYLQSGKGYMLNAAETQTFNYPDANVLSKTAIGKVASKSKTDTNDFAQYSSNMNIVAEIVDDTSFTKVLVYDTENVLRGVSDVVDFNTKRISFITVFSNTQDNLRFVLANNFEEVDINNTFTFKDNLVMGDLKNPVQLSAKALSLEDLILGDEVVYPNPFTNTIYIDLSKQNSTVSNIEIFNTIGVRLLSKKINNDQRTTLNTANLATGMYLIRFTDTAGKYVIKKMIKE